MALGELEVVESVAWYPGMSVEKPRAVTIVKGVVLCGVATGALVGLCLATVTRVTNPMYYLWSALMTMVAIPVVSALLTRHVASWTPLFVPPVWFLVLVAFLTLIIPVLGPVFGGTGNWNEVPIITFMGLVGGAVWSVPFAAVFVRASRM